MLARFRKNPLTLPSVLDHLVQLRPTNTCYQTFFFDATTLSNASRCRSQFCPLCKEETCKTILIFFSNQTTPVKKRANCDTTVSEHLNLVTSRALMEDKTTGRERMLRSQSRCNKSNSQLPAMTTVGTHHYNKKNAN